MNMATAYASGMQDFIKAEEMYSLTLNGYERSRGRLTRG